MTVPRSHLGRRRQSSDSDGPSFFEPAKRLSGGVTKMRPRRSAPPRVKFADQDYDARSPFYEHMHHLEPEVLKTGAPIAGAKLHYDELPVDFAAHSATKAAAALAGSELVRVNSTASCQTMELNHGQSHADSRLESFSLSSQKPATHESPTAAANVTTPRDERPRPTKRGKRLPQPCPREPHSEPASLMARRSSLEKLMVRALTDQRDPAVVDCASSLLFMRFMPPLRSADGGAADLQWELAGRPKRLDPPCAQWLLRQEGTRVACTYAITRQIIAPGRAATDIVEKEFLPRIDARSEHG